jgi:hypothetical protein
MKIRFESLVWRSCSTAGISDGLIAGEQFGIGVGLC